MIKHSRGHGMTESDPVLPVSDGSFRVLNTITYIKVLKLFLPIASDLQR